jgi:branched-chain amino acid transport system substrate-binding protein
VTAPGSYVFANSSSSLDGMSSVVRFFRERGMTHLAVLNATDASGQAVDKTLATAFALPENKNVVVVAHEHFAPTDISVSAQLTRIKAANPQGLISWAVGTPFATVLRGLNDAGLDVPIMTGAGNMTFAQVRQYSAFLPKHLYFEGFLAMATGPDVPKRVRDAQVLFHRVFQEAGIVPDGGYVGIYDMATIYVAAFKRYNGAPTAEQVHDFIEGLRNYAGANGIYDYRTYPQRGLGQESNVVQTYDPAKDAFVPVSKPGGYR